MYESGYIISNFDSGINWIYVNLMFTLNWSKNLSFSDNLEW